MNFHNSSLILATTLLLGAFANATAQIEKHDFSESLVQVQSSNQASPDQLMRNVKVALRTATIPTQFTQAQSPKAQSEEPSGTSKPEAVLASPQEAECLPTKGLPDELKTIDSSVSSEDETKAKNADTKPRSAKFVPTSTVLNSSSVDSSLEKNLVGEDSRSVEAEAGLDRSRSISGTKSVEPIVPENAYRSVRTRKPAIPGTSNTSQTQTASDSTDGQSQISMIRVLGIPSVLFLGLFVVMWGIISGRIERLMF